MLKIRVILTFLLVSTANLSRGQWVQQSAIPTGRHLNSVYFITPTHGFVVGDNRHLIETMDGGATWTTRMTDSLGTDPFYRVYFSDNVHGYITGISSTVAIDAWRTSDGGQSWIPMTSVPVGGTWRQIDFVTPTHGFIGTSGACAYTSDGGVNWTVRSGFPNCPNMYGMDFRDEQVGLVAGNFQGGDGIYKTTDGGVTWQQKFSQPANDVLWWTNETALADVGTSIYRSTNAGESWMPYATGVMDGVMKFARVDNVTLAAVSSKGDVWRSSNEGATWTLELDGPGDLPASWSIQFTDAQHGWVTGQSGFLYSSEDGGITWRQVNNGAGIQLFDIQMQSSSFGLGVGHNGYVFRTTNGGNRWEVQKLEVTGQVFGRDESLHSLSIVDSGFAVVAGPGGTVFRTYNGGVSWESIGYPSLPGFFWIEDVEFVNRDEGWLVGLDRDDPHNDKTVYRTTNGGTTWTQGMTQPSYMFAVDFVGSQHGWIATIGQLNFRTTDGGGLWVQGFFPPYPPVPTITISDIKFADQNTGWAVGWDGLVARSIDGGASWTYQNVGTTEEHFFSIHVASASEAWLTGREADVFTIRGVVYHTTNGGVSWDREVTSQYPYWGYGITGSGRDVWIAGYEGRIYRKQFPASAGENGPEPVPTRLHLAQNYPNPFNPTTTIMYAIARPGFVNLKVFDVLGREVATLVNEEKPTGRYSVQWNAAKVGSGTFYYRLESNGRHEIKKMLFIK